MQLTGAEIVWESLLNEGIEVVFGYPGGAILPTYDALNFYPSIRHVLVRHEQAAIHMADGYARASGKVGVAISTSGPGATNMISGIATAMRDAVPVVCITGQAATPVIGTDAFQETDMFGVSLPVTKHNYLVTEIESLISTFYEAFHIARTGRPGPVLIDLPKDIQTAKTEFRYPEKTKTKHEKKETRTVSTSQHKSGEEKAEFGSSVAELRRHANCDTDGKLGALHVIRCILEVNNKEEVIVVSDVGQRHLQAALPSQQRACTIITPGGFVTRGYALPAGIGVKLAQPDKEIWVVAGDDGFQRTQAELATITQEELPIHVAITNYNFLDTTSTWQKYFCEHHYAPPASLSPDFCKLADAHGILAFRARDNEDITPLIEKVTTINGPVLVDFRT